MIYIDINQAQLKASRCDILSIVQSLKDSNLNYPGGSTKEKFYEYLIRTMGEFEHITDIGKTVITLEDLKEQQKRQQEESSGGWGQLGGESDKDKEKFRKRIITLDNVAATVDGFKEVTSYSRYNGKENISVSIQKQTSENTIKTASGVKKELQNIEPLIPKGVVIDIVYDQSIFIENSIQDLADNAWQGGLLAFLTLLFFLRSFTNALIVIFMIPTSVLATFALMKFFGITINMMSLGGLAMGVGMITDSGVVLIENIFVKRGGGMGQKESAIAGCVEMGMPVLSSTLANAAVFAPILFVIGIAGQLFKELSLVVVFVLLASVPIALTIIPRLYSIGNRPFVERPEFGIMIRARKIYEAALRGFLRFPGTGLTAIFALFIVSVFLMTKLDIVAMPKVDEGKFTIKVDLKTGTVLEITNGVVSEVEKLIIAAPEVKDVSVRIGSSKSSSAGATLETLGSHQGQIMVNMKKGIKVSTVDFVEKLKEKIDKIKFKESDLTITYITNESEFGSAFSGGADIVIDVKGPDLKKLTEITEALKERLATVNGITGIKDTIPKSSPETRITVKKDKAASYGLSVKSVAEAALFSIKGTVATKLKEGGREVDIMVRMREEDRKNIETLKKNIYIRTPQGFDVPLNDVCELKMGMGPSEIIRQDQQRTFNVLINVYGRGVAEVEKDVEGVLASVFQSLSSADKDKYAIKIGGDKEETARSFQSLLFALILSILLIYMIMASQFESLFQPFIIMFSIPLSLIGVVAALWITNTPLSGVAFFGLIILGGIVVNNGIVLIDYINGLREEGETLYDALVITGSRRFRPIVMTALSNLVGMIPLALGLGEGAELRSPMARAIIGGVFISTPLTLLVIPAILILIDRVSKKFRKQ